MRVATVGNFDGVHRGHQALIARARAALPGGPEDRVVVVTFHPHPATVLRPEAAPPMLTSLSRRQELLTEYGADEVVVVPFTRELAAHSPEDFARFLREDPRIAADRVVVGENFRFGHRASGDVNDLARFGVEFGFGVEAVPLASGETTVPWSSSFVRDRIADGDLASASAALGHPHRVEGPVRHGDARGRELGYPTANLAVAPDMALPPDGVYAGWLVEGPERYPAAISIGTNPQFAGTERRVEAYVLDRDDLDLYDHEVGLDLVARLRGQATFDSLEGLIEQMARDVTAARELLVG
ncbi:MAG: bifunctional riboflavin kinase/FAD synthetase [Candidatus Nanopelagicales bacterium]